MTRIPEQRSWPAGTFLARLSEPARAELLRSGTLVRYPSRHAVMVEGEQGHAVYILLDSLVKVTALVENGSRTLLGIRTNGDIVGEMAAFEDAPRSATVTTCRPSTMCVMKPSVFLSLLDRSPGTAKVLSHVTIDRLRFANRRRLDFAGYEAAVCLARVLVDLAAHHGSLSPTGLDIGLPITRAELGELIGIKERTVQKAMQKLSAQGMVLRRHRGVTITDLTALTAFADLKPLQIRPEPWQPD